MSPRLPESIAKIEDHFRPCRIEYAHIFRPSGELIRFLRGKKDCVAIPHGTEVVGNILTHNHPNSSSFSAKDAYLIHKTGLSEIRAYGKHGAYILRANNPQVRRDDPGFLKSLEKMWKKNPTAPQDFAERFGYSYDFEPYEGEALK